MPFSFPGCSFQSSFALLGPMCAFPIHHNVSFSVRMRTPQAMSPFQYPPICPSEPHTCPFQQFECRSNSRDAIFSPRLPFSSHASFPSIRVPLPIPTCSSWSQVWARSEGTESTEQGHGTRALWGKGKDIGQVHGGKCRGPGHVTRVEGNGTGKGYGARTRETGTGKGHGTRARGKPDRQIGL